MLYAIFQIDQYIAMCYNLIEVSIMEKPFTLLEQVKTFMLHEKLPCLGLQLGLELGRLPEFWEAEP